MFPLAAMWCRLTLIRKLEMRLQNAVRLLSYLHGSLTMKKKFGYSCLITRNVKETPFTVNIPEGLQVSGVIQIDQIKSLDWQARNAEFLCEIPDETIDEVLEKIGVLLQIL